MVNPPTPADYLGVGGDISATQTNTDSFGFRAAGDMGRLTKFLSSASRVSIEYEHFLWSLVENIFFSHKLTPR